MPVVAVVGGIMAASAGAGAIAAAGGIAAMGAASLGSLVVAGLQVVGGVASALGAITGNEKLMKVGMVASLGASAVSGLSALGSAGSSVSGAGATSVMGGAPAGDYAAFAARTTDAAGAASNALVKNIGGAADALTTTSVADIARNVSSNSSPLGMLGTAAAPANATAPAPKTSIAGVDANAPPRGGAPQSSLNNQPPPDVAPTSAFGKVGAFVNANPEMAKLGAGMLSGFGQASAEKEKLKAAERIAADKRSRINSSITGIQSAF